MQIVYFAYIIFVVILIFVLLPRLKNKPFMVLILSWMLLYPVMSNPDFMISIDFLGFDLQPNRVLFIILAPVLFLSTVTSTHYQRANKSKNNIGLHWFEKFIILFIITATIASFMNIQNVSTRKTIANVTQIISFLLVFFSAKRFISRDDFKILSLVIIGYAAISSILGTLQFFVDPQFFRTGTTLGAFGSFSRANGFFSSEYYQGLFLILAFVLGMGTISNKLMKIFIIGIISVGIFLTMHRLSWLVFILIAMIIWALSNRGSSLKIAISFLMGSILLLIIIFIPQSRILSQRGMVRFLEGRVMVDNLSIRLVLNEFALDLIRKYPQGIGDIWTDLYNHEASIYPKPIPFREYGALSIHNGFLSAGVKYGVIGFFTFTFIYVSAIFFFIRNKINLNIALYVPVLSVFTIFLFNSTQDFSFLGSQLNIHFALLLGSFTAIVNAELSKVPNKPNLPG